MWWECVISLVRDSVDRLCSHAIKPVFFHITADLHRFELKGFVCFFSGVLSNVQYLCCYKPSFLWSMVSP